jgi:hypothetical protein
LKVIGGKGNVLKEKMVRQVGNDVVDEVHALVQDQG